MKEKIKFLWLWYIILIIQYFILIIEILFFKKYNILWLLLGTFLLILGLYLPLKDKDIKKYFEISNKLEND